MASGRTSLALFLLQCGPCLQVLVEQGLGKYCDPDFVRYTSREMQEALDMTQEEMDRAAHEILEAERVGQGPLAWQPDSPVLPRPSPS